MDRLVAQIFDQKQKRLLEDLDQKINEVKEEYNFHGSLHSSDCIKAIFKVTSDVAVKILESLLEAYEQVQEDTGDNIILNSDKEIMDETMKIAAREGGRVTEIINKESKSLGLERPRELSFFWTNLQEDSRQKAEILIETERRRQTVGKKRK